MTEVSYSEFRADYVLKSCSCLAWAIIWIVQFPPDLKSALKVKANILGLGGVPTFLKTIDIDRCIELENINLWFRTV
jgi:hypothetical protein